MRNEKISDAIGNTDDELIRAADQVRKERKRPRWIVGLAAVLCVCVALGAVYPLLREAEPGGARQDGVGIRLAAPTYPVMQQYPSEELLYEDEDAYDEQFEAWSEDFYKQQDFGAQMDEAAFHSFVQTTARELLTDTDGENRVYSPANVYMGLSMLAEVTDGTSRAQVLSLLGVENVEELRKQANALWNASYCDDGTTASILANSFWLRDGTPYDKATVNRLATTYYASAFSGQTGTEEYNQLLRSWINEQTGGLLADQSKELKMNANTVIALVSTIYFKAAWENDFSKAATKPEEFHAPDGDVTADFMHSTEEAYYWGEHYGAVELKMSNAGSMWLILPDEDSGIDEVLADGEALEMVSSAEWSNRKRLEVRLALPKFDVSSDLDLKEGLKALGVTDAFDDATADFTPLTDIPDVNLEQATHAARVLIDEEGCEAAAYVMMVAADGAMIEEDKIDFVLDRPFIFVITGGSDQVLFVGTVYQP